LNGPNTAYTRNELNKTTYNKSNITNRFIKFSLTCAALSGKLLVSEVSNPADFFINVNINIIWAMATKINMNI